jgi:hypothetical protein
VTCLAESCMKGSGEVCKRAPSIRMGVRSQSDDVLL